MLILISTVLILFIVTIFVFRPEEVIFGSTKSWAEHGGHTSFFTVVAVFIFLGCLGLYYLYSIIMIVKNSIRIQKELPVIYKPAINFIK